jgi:TP901 family phage tail tape measure protein
MSTKHEHKSVFTADNKDFNRKANQVESKSQNLTKKLKQLGTALASYFGFAQIIRGLKQIIQVNAQFGQSIADLAAITGAAGRDLDFYREQAKEIGRTTTLSASQAVKAFELMGSARPELLKSKDALAAVTKEAVILAEAAGLDLPTATQALAKTLNQFEIASEDAGKAINVLAAGSKMGAEAIPGIADAIKVMGTSANMANISLETSVGMIETLAEKGLSGAESGTQLRNVILKLQSETDKFNPKVVGLNTALDNLADANYSAAELTQMFGLRNQQAAAILINNRDKLKAYTEAVTDTNVAYEQQAIRVDTLQGAWKGFKSAMEGVIIRNSSFNETLKTGIQEITKGINKLKEYTSAANDFLKVIGAKEYSKSELIDQGAEAAEGIVNNLKAMSEGTGLVNKLAGEVTDYKDKLVELQKNEKKNADAIIRTKSTILDLIKAYYAEKESIETANKEAEKVDEVTEEVTKTVGDYVAEIEELRESLKNVAIGHTDEAAAIKEKIKAYEELIAKTLEASIVRAPKMDTIKGTAEVDVTTGPLGIDTSQLEGMKEQVITVDELKNKIMELSEGMGIYAQAHIASVMATAESTDQLAAGLEKITDLYLNLTDAAGLFADEIMAASASGIDNMEDFAKTAANTAKKIIAAYLAEAVAGQVKAWAGTGPFGLIAAGIAAAGTVALFNSVVPSFAEGGAVTGPTLAMVGEAAGISSSNPEYIGTARQLAQMGAGGGRGQLTARISKGDLLFILNEGEKYNNNSF